MIKELVIDRATWVNGDSPEDSELYTEFGNKCCLGFLGEACGVKLGDMLRAGTPSNYSEIKEFFPKELFNPIASEDEEACKSVEGLLIQINDGDYDKEERELRLKQEFKKHLDIDLTFI